MSQQAFIPFSQWHANNSNHKGKEPVPKKVKRKFLGIIGNIARETSAYSLPQAKKQVSIIENRRRGNIDSAYIEGLDVYEEADNFESNCQFVALISPPDTNRQNYFWLMGDTASKAMQYFEEEYYQIQSIKLPRLIIIQL